ncbi:RNase P subunit [Pichia californica]|nr:RNase P subunit [[Candida] californica]
MRPFRNIPITKQKSTGFSFSRNVSTSNNNNYTHQFFNPSYISPKDLIRLDELGFNNNNHNSSSKNSNNKSIFKYVAPALSVTKNNIIFNNNSTTNENNDKINDNNLVYNLNNSNNQLTNDLNDKFLLLRKLNHKGNKNSRLNITINSINQNHIIFNIRRANSNNIKQILIPNNSIIFKKNYSTDNLEKDFSNLNINKDNTNTIEKSNNVKFQQINNQNNYKFNSIDDALDTFLYNDPIKSQELIIDSLLSLGKFNEILPIFNRMRNNNLIPSIEIYNKVLKSIQLRDTDESLEIRLTHLLNTYSDMLSNNLKPNNLTYELIINNLINGSIKSYKLSNFKNGYEYFKIAFELFLINQNNTNNINSNFKNNLIYINILICLNFFKIKDVINPNDLFNLISNKISSSNKIDFYIQMIKFSTLFKDLKFIENLYNNYIKNEINNKQIYLKKDLIYQELIQSYNLCNQFDKSSLMLDSIINKIDNKNSKNSQKLISDYISIFIKSQSLINPSLAFKIFHKFNNINWLPNINIESLLILSFSFLKSNDLNMSLKIWDFLIIKSNFDIDYNNLLIGKISNEYSIYISNFHNQLYLAILNSGNKNLILKSIREILCKNSLILDDSLLINFIRYLNTFDNNTNNDLIIKLILNQGYKRIMKNSSSLLTSKYSLNNYLSLIIDFISIDEMIKIFKSKLFKRTIEEYRLLNDNIYGILKIFQSLIFSNINKINDLNIDSFIKYYSKVLNYEFNDVDNCYVQIPQEIKDFKLKLEKLV